MEHSVLQELRSEHGEAIVDLVIEKKREVERYCPSGHYPTPVLFHDGQELRLPEAVTRLVDGLREARERIRALEKIVPQRRGALCLGTYVRTCVPSRPESPMPFVSSCRCCIAYNRRRRQPPTPLPRTRWRAHGSVCARRARRTRRTRRWHQPAAATAGLGGGGGSGGGEKGGEQRAGD